MKDVLKRWNELAGTDKKPGELKKTIQEKQEIYGNSFLREQLKESAGDFHPDLDEDVDEDIADQLASKDGESADGDADPKETGEIGDEEKETLSNTDLIKGLKTGAAAIADAIPNVLNDEFAEIMNDVKDIAQDKQKMLKLIRFIQKIK